MPLRLLLLRCLLLRPWMSLQLCTHVRMLHHAQQSCIMPVLLHGALRCSATAVLWCKVGTVQELRAAVCCSATASPCAGDQALEGAQITAFRGGTCTRTTADPSAPEDTSASTLLRHQRSIKSACDMFKRL